MKSVVMLAVSCILVSCGTTGERYGYQNLHWVQESIFIEGSVDDVWTVVAEDFDKSMLHIDRVKRSYYTDYKDKRIGSVRRSEYYDGDWLDVVITQYKPSSFIQWEMTDTSIGMLKEGVGAYSLVEEGAGTRLIQDAGYRTSVSVVDSVVKGRFKKMFRTILAGVKYQVEEDRPVEKGQGAKLVESYQEAFGRH